MRKGKLHSRVAERNLRYLAKFIPSLAHGVLQVLCRKIYDQTYVNVTWPI